ncbi:hypothetical protein AVEN_94565-1 [Araneus ventricosus]|uniref:Mutator-like transposase domain-containing protein n=1 Tax=Araneus ventricosus TaxID=182803 RepID=A0A4Y2N163_ARAVE|nr:hypothetical protein AVEN_145428-1 [Araneus ventricosus]GBN32622.1 hypothetical protein AVEN_94565-1 [Araneus ventricosus]
MRAKVILLENTPLNAVHEWQHNRLNHQTDVQICSQGAWDNHESAPAVIGNCSPDHNSRCRSSVSRPQREILKKRSGKNYKISEKAVNEVQNLSPNAQQTCAKERKLPNIDDCFSTENTGKGVSNSITDVNILARVFKNCVNCKNCNNGLELQVLKITSGLAVFSILNCFQCEYTHEFSSSEFHEGTQIATVNTRYVYALRCIGQGAEVGGMFCSVMNLPQPPTRLQICNKRLLNATRAVCESTMQKAVKEAIAENNSDNIILLLLLAELVRSEVTRHTMV